MRVSIEKIADRAGERVVIACVEVTAEVERIRDFALGEEERLTGVREGETVPLRLGDVCYFEAVDELVFAYTETSVLQVRGRLYALEERYAAHRFFRCSKSVLVNLDRIESIRPALNGRFTAALRGGERVIISRQYVPALRRVLEGGNGR